MASMKESHDSIAAYIKKFDVSAPKAGKVLGLDPSCYYKYRHQLKIQNGEPVESKRPYNRKPKFETVVVQGSESAPKVIALVGSGIEVIKALKELL